MNVCCFFKKKKYKIKKNIILKKIFNLFVPNFFKKEELKKTKEWMLMKNNN